MLVLKSTFYKRRFLRRASHERYYGDDGNLLVSDEDYFFIYLVNRLKPPVYYTLHNYTSRSIPVVVAVVFTGLSTGNGYICKQIGLGLLLRKHYYIFKSTCDYLII